MRGIICVALTLIVAGLLGLGGEWLAAFLPAQISRVFIQPYGIGIHPLSIDLNLCGLAGLILAYIIMSKFVKK